jgi:hypothetical protein
VLVAYVAGFCGNNNERKKFEHAWRNAAVARMQDPGISRSIQSIILAASNLINRYTDVHQLNRSSLPLRVVQFAEITTN